MSRRAAFASLLPAIVRAERAGSPVHLREIYAAIERDHSDLIDDEREASGGLRWQHELRWEVETLVGQGHLQRRKDLGRGLYTA